MRQQRDQEKREVCRQMGITLLEIPYIYIKCLIIFFRYWWDERLESVQATIHTIRPDAVEFSTGGVPISYVRPSGVHRQLTTQIKGQKRRRSKQQSP